MSRKKRERNRDKERKNAIYSGHLRLCQQPRAAHTLCSDQDRENDRKKLQPIEGAGKV